MLLSAWQMDAPAGAGRDGAGGDAIVHRAGGKPLPDGDRRVPSPQLLRLGLEAGEPTLGITEDGTVFFTAMQDSLRIEVLRSKDAGSSWDLVSPQFPTGQNAQLVSVDPYLYVDEDTNRVFTIDLTVACSYLSFTDDAGESWTTNPLACGRPINDHQTLFSGPPVDNEASGYRNVVYYCWNDVATSSCSRSLDGGITFAPTGTPAFLGFDPEGGEGFYGTEGFCGGLHGHGVVGEDGTVYLPREYCGRPFLAISSDEGATWTRVKVAGNGARPTDPTVDVDAKGNIYYAWVARNGLPYLSISRNGGMRWSEPLMIAAPGVETVNLLTLDAGRPGGVAFAYMGTEDAKHPKTWNGYMGMTTTALENEPIFFSASVNDKNDPFKRGLCGPARCGEEVLDFIDVVIGSDGTPWGAFVDACDARCARSGLEGGNEGVVGRLVGGPRLR